MTDKEFNRVRKLIRKYVKKWLPRLNFRTWDVTSVYEREPNPNAAAQARVKWQYKTLRMTFWCWELRDYTENELEEVVVHEMIHGRVNEMREWGPEFIEKELEKQAHDHEERVVTELTGCFLWIDREQRKK